MFSWDMKLHEKVIWFRPCENITLFLEPIRFWRPRHCISSKHQDPFTLQQQFIPEEERYFLFYIFNSCYWKIYKIYVVFKLRGCRLACKSKSI
jgi:hypothetical protein